MLTLLLCLFTAASLAAQTAGVADKGRRLAGAPGVGRSGGRGGPGAALAGRGSERRGDAEQLASNLGALKIEMDAAELAAFAESPELYWKKRSALAWN